MQTLSIGRSNENGIRAWSPQVELKMRVYYPKRKSVGFVECHIQERNLRRLIQVLIIDIRTQAKMYFQQVIDRNFRHAYSPRHETSLLRRLRHSSVLERPC